MKTQKIFNIANRLVVDTCVVSYILKNHPLAQEYRPLLEGKSLGLSFKGRPMPSNDAWIAATALRYDTPLVTHNVKDFEHLQNMGLNLITVPFKNIS